MHDMPMLPASFVDVYGYSSMFVHCSSITSDAYLPAMDFSYNSYMNMFSECSSLTAIHFPKAFQDDETILKKAGSDAPWFGATTATIYYDL